MFDCPHCGTLFTSSDKFCAGCGKPVKCPTADIQAEDQLINQENKLSIDDEQLKNKKKRRNLAWVICLVFLAILGYGLYESADHALIQKIYDSIISPDHFRHERKLQIITSIAENSFNDGVPKILYNEDFNSGTATNWDIWIDHPTSIDPGWIVIEVDYDYCFEGKGHTFARPNSTRRGLIDYSITFKLNILEYSSSGDTLNFSFREFFDPGHKRYYLGIGRSGINLIKQSTQSHSTLSGKDFKTLKRASFSINPNRWYVFKISVRENDIKVYIDDKLVIEHADQESPYLEGGIAFETLDYGHVLIDDIKISAEILTGTEVLLAEEDQINIDPLQATVKALRFFEEGEDGNSDLNKTYEKTFLAEEIRFIWWELYMNCEPGRKSDFAIHVEYFDPDGELIHSGVVEGFYIEYGWTESIHSAGFGFETPGSWKPGIYKVRLYLEDLQIAEGHFMILAQEETLSEIDSDLVTILKNRS